MAILCISSVCNVGPNIFPIEIVRHAHTQLIGARLGTQNTGDLRRGELIKLEIFTGQSLYDQA